MPAKTRKRAIQQTSSKPADSSREISRTQRIRPNNVVVELVSRKPPRRTRNEGPSGLQEEVSHSFIKRGHPSNDKPEVGARATGRRRLFKRRKTDDESSSSEEDMAAADSINTRRLRTRKLTKYQKNLERLKRRKLRQASEPSSSSEDSDLNSEVFSEAAPTSDFDSLFDEDSDRSSDFIVQDNDTLRPSLPTQFSMETYQGLDHQFKKIFQFFVHVAVRPAKERHSFMKALFRKEEYFSVAVQVTRRNLSGMRDSLVSSSVWRPEFKKPIESYPEFDLLQLDHTVPSCDACHLGGRVATILGRLSGLPYDPWGFESLDEHANTENNSSDDESKDSDEAVVSPTEFHLGRFCAQRTRVYHEFTHWEFALFKCVRDEVDDLHASKQSDGFFRIAYIGGKQPPEDLDDADGICAWLDERKVIDMQWEKINAMMESARNLQLASKRGEADDDQQ